jgi:hypothetical protein
MMNLNTNILALVVGKANKSLDMDARGLLYLDEKASWFLVYTLLEGFWERYILKPDIFPKTRYLHPTGNWTLGVNWCV